MRRTRFIEYLRANTLGLVAVFIALGGTAYATHPGGDNTISSGDIIDGEVQGGDILNDAVSTADLSNDNGVRSPDVRNDNLTGGGLNAQDLNPDSVGTSELAGAAVTIPKLAFDPATQTELNAHKSSGDHDGRYWTLGGNEETVPGRQFLGTTDDTPLELWVNNARALRIEPASDGANVSPNVIGGIADNSATAGVHSATIGGGGRSDPADPATANRVTDHRGTIAGGVDNQAGDGAGTTSDRPLATVGGGEENTASGSASTVAGGQENTASGSASTVAGGQENTASSLRAFVGGGIGNVAAGSDAIVVAGGSQNFASGGRAAIGGGDDNYAPGFMSTVGGGESNTASGSRATVPGGTDNIALGNWSLAAGREAMANHEGAFVWSDSSSALQIESSAPNQFIARAAGGFYLQNDGTLDEQADAFLNTSTGAFLSDGGAWTNASDENLKSDFEAVEPHEVLGKVAELPVRSWSYEAEPGVRHLGPTAQDFRTAFGLGADDRHIASVDADGVALAAIKGLNERLDRVVERQRERIAALERELRGDG